MTSSHRTVPIAPVRAAVGLAAGTVSSIDPEGMAAIRVDGVSLCGKRSAGCLLSPEVRDLVLVARTPEGCFILDVLERRGDGPAELSLPEKTVVAAGNGKGELEIRSGALSLAGNTLRTLFSRVTAAAGVVESKADMIRETFRRRYEDVEEVKDSRLGRLRCVVSGLLSFRGKTVAGRAEKRMTLDGDSIEIG